MLKEEEKAKEVILYFFVPVVDYSIHRYSDWVFCQNLGGETVQSNNWQIQWNVVSTIPRFRSQTRDIGWKQNLMAISVNWSADILPLFLLWLFLRYNNFFLGLKYPFLKSIQQRTHSWYVRVLRSLPHCFPSKTSPTQISSWRRVCWSMNSSQHLWIIARVMVLVKVMVNQSIRLISEVKERNKQTEPLDLV